MLFSFNEMDYHLNLLIYLIIHKLNQDVRSRMDLIRKDSEVSILLGV